MAQRSWMWFVGALAAVAGLSTIAAARLIERPAHFADADDHALTIAGKRIYAQQCASCHGRYLQGQPLWRMADLDVHRRAPAQDQSGHTWRHADEALFQMIKFGRFPDVPRDQTSRMPAYADRLSDAEILAVMGFIKGRWPTGIRVLQAMLNPGQQGMPRDAAATDWTIPDLCSEREALVAGRAK